MNTLSEENLVDLFTKALIEEHFDGLQAGMHVVSITNARYFSKCRAG